MASKYVLPLNTNLTQINPTTDEGIVLLRKIVKLLESSAVTDSTQQQRVSANQLTQANLLCTAYQATAANLNATVTGSITATSAASTVNMGQVVIGYGGQATAAANIIDSRFTLIDQARNAYANGLRFHMSWGSAPQ